MASNYVRSATCPLGKLLRLPCHVWYMALIYVLRKITAMKYVPKILHKATFLCWTYFSAISIATSTFGSHAWGAPPSQILTNLITNVIGCQCRQETGKIPNHTDSERLKIPKTDYIIANNASTNVTLHLTRTNGLLTTKLETTQLSSCLFW